MVERLTRGLRPDGLNVLTIHTDNLDFVHQSQALDLVMDRIQDKLSGKEVHAIMNLCMAATYDPDPNQFLGVRLPVDLETGELIPERWRNWLAHDPAIVVDKYADNLRKLRAIYIDCGDEDQYHLHFGSRRLHQALDRLKIVHTYEEFADNHSDVDYRMDVSLPFLERALR